MKYSLFIMILLSWSFGELFGQESPKNENLNVNHSSGNSLIVEHNEYPFYHNLLDEKRMEVEINLSSKWDLVIQSIKSSTGDVFAHLSNTSLPFTLAAGESIPLVCEFAPTPLSFIGNDTIRIHTIEPNPVVYDIFCMTNTAHIDSRNIRELDSVVLSKKNDGFFIINVLGSETDIHISNEITSRKYKISGFDDPLKIDLSDYQEGSYHVHILSCSLWGDFTLVVRD